MQFDGGRGLLKAILATKIADHIQIPLQNFWTSTDLQLQTYDPAPLLKRSDNDCNSQSI